jgi:hypothetical protein
MRFGWNVGKLKELIKDLPDDTVILVPGSDHSYHQPNCHIAPAELCDGDYYEYWNDECMTKGAKKIDKTLVIGG